MADLKPSTATLASVLDGTERIPCTQAGASRALTPALLLDYIGNAKEYTPTLTNTTNITSSTAFALKYVSLDNCVFLWGRIDIDPTAALTLTEIEISLPIASNFSSTGDAAGSGNGSGLGMPGIFFAHVANDRLRYRFISDAGAASTDHYISGFYLVR